MRVHVDPRLCEGHGLCVETAPAVFTLADDDLATCVERPASDLHALVRAAVDVCPRGAITITEDP